MEKNRHSGIAAFEQVGNAHRAAYRPRRRGHKANEGASNYQSLLAVCRTDDGFVIGSDTRVARFGDGDILNETEDGRCKIFALPENDGVLACTGSLDFGRGRNVPLHKLLAKAAWEASGRALETKVVSLARRYGFFDKTTLSFIYLRSSGAVEYRTYCLYEDAAAEEMLAGTFKKNTLYLQGEGWARLTCMQTAKTMEVRCETAEKAASDIRDLLNRTIAEEERRWHEGSLVGGEADVYAVTANGVKRATRTSEISKETT